MPYERKETLRRTCESIGFEALPKTPILRFSFLVLRSSMRLVIADKIIADAGSDGLTRWMRAEKPELRLRADSREIVGVKYARNSSRAWGQYYALTVTVGRQFASYAEAEDFWFAHSAELSDGAEGILKYEGILGKLYGFENAALEAVRPVSEIGVSTEIEYSFRCGKPCDEFDSLIVVQGSILKIGEYFPYIKFRP